MIIDKLVSILMSALNGILGLAPAWSFGLDLSNIASTFGHNAAIANNWFPVVTLGACLGVVLGLKAALLLWRAAIFLYRLIPGKFT